MSIAFMSMLLFVSLPSTSSFGLLFASVLSRTISSLLSILLLWFVLLSVGNGDGSVTGAEVGARWSNAHPSRLAIDGRQIILYTRLRGRLDWSIKSSTLLVAF
jgi:hypothetical protein